MLYKLRLINILGIFLLLPQTAVADDSCQFAEALAKSDVSVYQYHTTIKEHHRSFKQSLFLIRINYFDRHAVTFGDATASPVTLYAFYTTERTQSSIPAYLSSFVEFYHHAPDDYPTQSNGFIVLAGHEFFIDSLTFLESGEMAALTLKESGFNPFFKKKLSFHVKQFAMLKSPAKACHLITNFINDYRAAKQYLDTKYQQATSENASQQD